MARSILRKHGISKLSNSFSLASGTSKTVTVYDNGAEFLFLVYGVGWQANLAPVMFLIGGYATASRSKVTNISGNTGIAINSSSTSSKNFIISNSSGAGVTLWLLPFGDISFGIS